MKNLANCKPSEFLRQTSKIKKSVEKWLTDTDILNIRKNMPELEKIGVNMSVEEKAEIYSRNKEKLKAQSRANASKILDAVLDKHPDETLELLALICFVEPEKVDDHSISEYFEAITEMMENQAVIGFFTSLMRWGQMNISDASEA